MKRSIIGSFASTTACLLLSLAGCGGGEGGSSATAAPPAACLASSCGTALISLTDADGDFASYTVDVVSLTLKRADGAVVETLPIRQRVDFAELVELAEFVTAATVPVGTYVAGSIRLDYTNAEVRVDVGGQARAARVVDPRGDPVGLIDLEIRLDGRNRVFIAPGRPAFLQLDFDLPASNTLGDLAADPVTVELAPFIVASVQRLDSREFRVRGPLAGVDEAAASYTIDLRPFHHRDARHGRFVVQTSAATTWEIDGTPYVGAAGLEALAARPAGTATAAFGAFDVSSRTYAAERVHAGTSVRGAQVDVIRGSVLARRGDELTVRGVTLVRRDGSVKFLRGDATVLIGADTGVTKDGRPGETVTIEAISVGQRIHAFGDASPADTAERVTLDATRGRLRLHLTRLSGLVKSALPGSLVLDLLAIDRHRAAAFDFAGTGSSPATDADPGEYEIATDAPGVTGLPAGTPARVFGFVTPFGAAPPDFAGRTVIGFEEVLAVLTIGWGESGTSAPFSSMNATGLVIDASNPDIGARHHILFGPQVVDILALATPVRLVPDPAAPGLFAIGEPGAVEVFSDFAEFQAALAESLGALRAVGSFSNGRFDAATGDFVTARVLIRLQP